MTCHLNRRHLLAACAFLPLASRAQSFDHSHAAWTALLKKHVLVLRGGQASQVRYAGMAADHAVLKDYLDTLSGVGKPPSAPGPSRSKWPFWPTPTTPTRSS